MLHAILTAADYPAGDAHLVMLTWLGSCVTDQVIEDLKDECSKFGEVVAVSVPRPGDPSTSTAVFNTGNFGKVSHLLVAFLRIDVGACEMSLLLHF